ncbi:hypothetical protein [Neolewinella maritima]|uniref:hypothetical protein n=1 Tax=Neolewinella maritima TaxID=1383882 RepID=UPI001EE9A177|nr:hypothetical protein [Neolewinella maritima]
MEYLENIIDEIIKYGLDGQIEIDGKDKDLELNLVKLYSKFFEINYQFDQFEYDGFKRNDHYPRITENVRSNFQDYSFYHTVSSNVPVNEKPIILTGDAIEDISEIINDLLEVKWRNQNNSADDALWYFELIFNTHTRYHLVSLLNYINFREFDN